jgi:hypothetical protein
MNAAARARQPQWMRLTIIALPDCKLRRSISDGHVAAVSTLCVEIHTIELSKQEDENAA